MEEGSQQQIPYNDNKFKYTFYRTFASNSIQPTTLTFYHFNLSFELLLLMQILTFPDYNYNYQIML